ncbi:Crp/Fnr family transcriptional regulator [Aureispira anguillae]|uniref:Crp/Fnr family transcriptional regulator n=1 Tax=Aureispira anguillae TaxID=2864201 RepID=UPI00222E0D97|nr:Crp/Fnr family transcriptional regulator [Aureispira anguillae]
MNISNLSFESDKILSSLPEEERAYFLSFSKQLFFKKGKLIFYQDGMPTGVFLIQSGKAKLYKTGMYGKDQIFYIYRAGDLFGYHALLCNENYEESCEVLEDSTVLFVNKYDFRFLLQKIPRIQALIIQNISHEFGVLVNTITILAQKNLRERLALYLVILKERYEGENAKNNPIVLPREDLANIIGTTRESLGRLLKEFKEDQLIRVNKRAIEISNLEKLQKMANVNP